MYFFERNCLDLKKDIEFVFLLCPNYYLLYMKVEDKELTRFFCNPHDTTQKGR